MYSGTAGFFCKRKFLLNLDFVIKLYSVSHEISVQLGFCDNVIYSVSHENGTLNYTLSRLTNKTYSPLLWLILQSLEQVWFQRACPIWPASDHVWQHQPCYLLHWLSKCESDADPRWPRHRPTVISYLSKQLFYLNTKSELTELKAMAFDVLSLFWVDDCVKTDCAVLQLTFPFFAHSLLCKF